MIYIMLNDRLRGFHRDRDVLESIRTYEVLNTEQVYILHFSELRHGLKKARERLRKLYNIKRINRGRLDLTESCYYYDGKRPNGIEHIINRNWGFIYLLHQANQWERMADWRREYSIGPLQADGFLGLHNSFTKMNRYWFVESDRSASNNKFEKIRLYNELYKSDSYLRESWAKLKITSRFPTVLIVTDTDKKASHIQRLIEQENKENLLFEVITIESIKELLITE